MKNDETNLQTISTDIGQLKTDVTSVLSKLELLLKNDDSRSEDVKTLQKENSNLKMKVASLEGITAKMQLQLDSLHSRLNKAENLGLNQNVFFTNLKEDGNDEETVRHMMQMVMQIPSDLLFSKDNLKGEIKIDYTYRLGKPRKTA